MYAVRRVFSFSFLHILGDGGTVETEYREDIDMGNKPYRVVFHLALFFSILFFPAASFADETEALGKALEIFNTESLSHADAEQCRPFLEKELNFAINAASETGNETPLYNTGDERSQRLACLDEYSSFLSREEVLRINEKFEGDFGGIGVQLKVDGDKVAIDEVTSGGAADRAGLKQGDIITRVQNSGQEHAVYISNLTKAVSALRGKEGSVVSVTVSRGGEILTFSITRERIQIQTVRYAHILPGIGYVQVTEHNVLTPFEFEYALRELKNKDGPTRVIVDMRDNPGGVLFAPEGMLFYFSDNPEDTIVTTRTRNSEKVETVGSMAGAFINPQTSEQKTPGAFKDYFVVVLINGESASASEIFAGTMQDWGRDNGRFKIIGTKSYGKGVGQTIFKLPDGLGFQLTTFEFLVGNHRLKIQGVGVRPDLVIPDTRSSRDDTLTKRDMQFRVAIEFIKSL